MSSNRKESERTKLIQEKCQSLLTQMLRDEDNKYCVDCDAKGPRWASWNLGVFLCIRCAGIHRNLGVHISRVKSVNLDTWTPEQVISLQQMGNSRARAVYEAQLPDGFRRPQTDTALESFIRAKYEQKKYLAREWVPPPLPKVDWAKEIDEELDKQKRKKKAAQASSVFGISVNPTGSDKKATGASKSNIIPEPLAKPKNSSSSSNNSPKTQPPHKDGSHTSDLLGLSSPTKPVPPSRTSESEQNMQNNFGNFLGASPVVAAEIKPDPNEKTNNTAQNLLVKEEEDFFNQGSLGAASGDKDKSQKLTKDSILALYGTGASTGANTYNMQLNYGQSMFGGVTGSSPGYMNATHPQQQQQQQQQQQFMTPPNSTSMYNAPVMTAPTAFTAPGMSMMGGGAFSAQFPVQNLNNVSFPQQLTNANLIAASKPGQMNPTFMPSATNNALLHGGMMGNAIDPMMQISSGMSMPATNAFSTPNTASAALNQQFSNLNIGNVWQ